MLQHLSSLDHRLDVLVFETSERDGGTSSIFQRRGIVQLCYFDVRARAVPNLLQRRVREKSLPHRGRDKAWWAGCARLDACAASTKPEIVT